MLLRSSVCGIVVTPPLSSFLLPAWSLGHGPGPLIHTFKRERRRDKFAIRAVRAMPGSAQLTGLEPRGRVSVWLGWVVRGLRRVYVFAVTGLRPPPWPGGFPGFMRPHATRRDWRRHLINARNEGVRGSNPRVGFPCAGRYVCDAPRVDRHGRRGTVNIKGPPEGGPLIGR